MSLVLAAAVGHSSLALSQAQFRTNQIVSQAQSLWPWFQGPNNSMPRTSIIWRVRVSNGKNMDLVVLLTQCNEVSFYKDSHMRDSPQGLTTREAHLCV